MAVDATTAKSLQDVRKGKPRRFLMLCKGAKIVSMFVYRKGSLESFKKQARAEATGKIFHGVVDGQGQDISFKLSRDDGYDKPPGRELILRDFLKTSANLKSKATYEIVDNLPEVNEDDENEALPGAAVEAPSRESDSQSTPREKSPGKVDPAESFKQRLTELVGQVKQAAGTTQGKEAKLKVNEAGVFARKQEFEQGHVLLDEAEQILQGSASATPKSGPNPSSTLASQFKAQLAELIPRIKQAAGTPGGEQAKQKASAAGALVRKKEFEQALSLLGEAEQALRSPRVVVPDLPTSEPSNKAITAMRKIAKRISLTTSDDHLLNDLAGLGPGFVALALDEPEMSTNTLEPGSPIAPQDQMTEIAGLLDGLGRKLDQWESALEEAESAKTWLSGAESNDADALSAHETYQQHRLDGVRLMEEVSLLVGDLRKQCANVAAAL